VEHKIECSKTGIALGSKALTVLVGDGPISRDRQKLSTRSTGIRKREEDLCGHPEGVADVYRNKLYEPPFIRHVTFRGARSIFGRQGIGHRRNVGGFGSHAPSVQHRADRWLSQAFGKLGGFILMIRSGED